MGLIKKRKSLRRELRLLKSTLAVSKKRDVSSTDTGRLLKEKGLVGKKSGKITAKGRKALRLL